MSLTVDRTNPTHAHPGQEQETDDTLHRIEAQHSQVLDGIHHLRKHLTPHEYWYGAANNNEQGLIDRTVIIDTMHNPSANTITLTLGRDGMPVFTHIFGPYEVLSNLNMHFTNGVKCISITGGSPITLWGRVPKF